MMLSTTKRPTTNKIFFHLFIVCIAISLSTCRPQNTIDSQDFSEYQIPNDDDLQLQQVYNSPYPAAPAHSQIQNRAQYFLDNAPMQRIQWLIGRMKPVSSGSWNSLYRVPESKRQVRYRQCYFNPISCFRK